MFQVVVPFAVVDRGAVCFNELALPVSLVLGPLSVINVAIKIIEATLTVEDSSRKLSLIGANTDKEHKSLPLEVPISEVALEVVSILKVEGALAADLAIPPASLEGVSIPVVHSTVSLLSALREASLIAVTIVRDEDALSLELVELPLAIVDRPVGEKHLSCAAFNIFMPVSIVYGAVFVIEDASTLPRNFANVLSPIREMQLIYTSTWFKALRDSYFCFSWNFRRWKRRCPQSHPYSSRSFDLFRFVRCCRWPSFEVGPQVLPRSL